MKKNGIDLLRPFSLILIGVCTLLLVGPALCGVKIPESAVRVAGVCDLLALPVLAYATIRKIRK